MFCVNIIISQHLEACESSRDVFKVNIFANVCGYVWHSFKVYVNGIRGYLLWNKIMSRRACKTSNLLSSTPAVGFKLDSNIVVQLINIEVLDVKLKVRII